MRAGTVRTTLYTLYTLSTMTLLGVIAGATAAYHRQLDQNKDMVQFAHYYHSKFYENALSPIFYASLTFCTLFLLYLFVSLMSFFISRKSAINSVLADTCALLVAFCFEFSCIIAATVWVWHDGQFHDRMTEVMGVEIPYTNLAYVATGLGWWLASLIVMGLVGMPVYALRKHGHGTLRRTLYDLEENGPWVSGPRAALCIPGDTDDLEYVHVPITRVAPAHRYENPRRPRPPRSDAASFTTVSTGPPAYDHMRTISIDSNKSPLPEYVEMSRDTVA